MKINISLTDMNDFVAVNEVMSTFLEAPYPARACVEVAGRRSGAALEFRS